MNQIKADKKSLIAQLQENRDRHKAIFDEAVAGYRKQAIEALEAHIERIQKGKLVAVAVVLPLPENHTRDYDRVLGMLQMSLDETIMLSEADYQQYVQDDWAWKRQFLHSNSTYSATAAAAMEG